MGNKQKWHNSRNGSNNVKKVTQVTKVTEVIWITNVNSSVKGFRPHGLLVYRLCLPPDTLIIFIYLKDVTVVTIVTNVKAVTMVTNITEVTRVTKGGSLFTQPDAST